MDSNNLAAPIWVDQNDSLQQMVNDLARQKIIAVDTESNSLYVYREQVCLVQISTLNIDYLVDTLALTDLSLVAPIFADETIEKVFHAAEYDLICLKRDFGFSFSNIFDTMFAGRILGRKAVGLASMLKAEFGIELDKRFQRANWGKRPLPKAQLVYARLDSRYLIPLRQRLADELVKCGRWQLAQEDFSRLCDVKITPEVDGIENCQRAAGNLSLTSQQANVLRELCKYREIQAQRANLPPFKILGKQTLLEIARVMPRLRDDLASNTKISQRQLERHADGLLKAVERGMRCKQHRNMNHYHRQPVDEKFIYRLEALRNWRKQTGHTLGVESDVIMPRDILEIIAQNNPQRIDELQAIMQPIPWRFEHFGSQLLKVLHF